MLTFLVPLLLGTILGFLIRGKPSGTFAITTGKRVAWGVGIGMCGVVLALPLGLAISSTTGPQIAGLIGAGLGFGVFNILSIENATYKKWSDKNALAWLVGGLVVIGISVGLLTTNKRDNETEISSTSNAASTESPDSTAIGRHAQNKASDSSLADRRRQAEAGDANAQYHLGWMYYYGEGVLKNFTEAVKWFRRAADQGNANAQYNLGWMYYYGEGVPKEFTEAVKWYRRAAEQGLAIAQFNLGNMYYYGEGVPKEFTEAVKWYRRAAEQGDASAQFNLAQMYRRGEGVPKNATEALKWYRRAADQGYAGAQLLLGWMYYNGEGVPKNDTEAYFWYNLAAAQGNEMAKENRDIAEKNMTREQIAEAQRRSAAWKPKTE